MNKFISTASGHKHATKSRQLAPLNQRVAHQTESQPAINPFMNSSRDVCPISSFCILTVSRCISVGRTPTKKKLHMHSQTSLQRLQFRFTQSKPWPFFNANWKFPALMNYFQGVSNPKFVRPKQIRWRNFFNTFKSTRTPNEFVL